MSQSGAEPMDLNLRGNVVLVTGGAGGIGRAVAEGFASEDARVAIWDRSAQAETPAREIADRFGVPTIGLRVDVTNERDVTAAVEQTESDLGPIDHLVHAAAVGSGKFGCPFTNLTPADWKDVLDVNIMGMVHVAHALAPRMVERRQGTMLFVSSVAGQIGSPTDPPYSAGKAAGINFAQCMARDLAPHGIRVNSLCPGMVQTELNRSVWQAWHDRQPPEGRLGYEEWADEKIRQLIPLGSWQQPSDLADMAVFLASPRAAQITGQTINVDGGYVMHW